MSNKENIQHQFGISANKYVTSAIHRKGKDLDALIGMIEATDHDIAIDIATGGGHTANALAPLVQKVIAFDLTQEMLDAARTFIAGNGYHNVNFLKGDAENMPFSSDTFDIVTCRIAPHHFPNVEKFISEVYRILKPGGTFLLDDNVAPEKDEFDQFYNTIEKRRDYSHFRAWKKTEWLRMLELSGFEIQEWRRFEKTFEFGSWCKRMNLPVEEEKALNTFMIEATDNIKAKFHIQVENEQVKSFKGEAILLKAIKRAII